MSFERASSLPMNMAQRVTAALLMAILASVAVGAASSELPPSVAGVRFIGESLPPSLFGAFLLTRFPYIKRNVGFAVTVGVLYWLCAAASLVTQGG